MNAADAQPRPRWQRAAAALGFHVPALAFALRTALAAFAALALAHAMGLEHPHWAAMSAWAASQPMREHLLSRGLYRFGGSVVGVVYAVALVLLAQDSLWVLAFGLALWVAACAFLGNLQRGYLVYGCMLAGYSAAMVVLLHHGPADSVWPLAWDRMLTVITGVAAALCISWCFAPRRKAAVLIAQSRSALAQVLQAAAAQLRQPSAGQALDQGHLLSRLAQVEELLELYPEGSRTARNTSRAMHWQQHYAMELVYQLGQAQGNTGAGAGLRASASSAILAAGSGALAPAQIQAQRLALCDAVDQLAQAMHAAPHAQGASPQGLNHALHQAIRACEVSIASLQGGGQQALPGLHALYLLLQAIRRGLRAEALDLNLPARSGHSGQRGKGRKDCNGRHASPLALHRDWVGAREAALRAGGTLLVFGMVWAWTGSGLVAFGMLGLSVMLLVFSAFESPSHTMAFVLRGQLIGAGLALLCQSWVWPLAQSSWQMVAMLLPFALMGGLVFAHKRTAAGAMDTNMAMFILLAPVFPAAGSFGQHLSMALVVVSGPALAWVVYRWVYPTNGQRRLQTLARMMVQEVPDLARRLLQDGRPVQWQARPAHPSNRWQVQLHHRLLRLVRWADKTQWPERAVLPRMALSLRAMPATLLQLQQWRRETILVTPALRRTERLAVLALHRLVQWGAGTPSVSASRNARAAWQALAQQSCLPAALAEQAQCLAQRDIPALDGVRYALHAPQTPQTPQA